MAKQQFSLSKCFKKLTMWDSIFLVILLIIITVIVNNLFFKKPSVEGFKETTEFIVKKGTDIYDNFYGEVYDDLVFNKIKNDFEIGTIINKTEPTEQSIILDVGSGTGHHVDAFTENGFKATGIDKSSDMVKLAKEMYPDNDYIVGDVLKPMTFPPNSFTHITCLYFTIYYIKNNRKFLKNCYDWLMPGGHLILHLVDKSKFDPILPAGDPFDVVSPQNYAKKRITSTIVKFDDYDYKANFEEIPNTNDAILKETFKNTKTGNVRQNKHELYMPSQASILSIAKDLGFILMGQIDMIRCQYDSQYLYILQKTN